MASVKPLVRIIEVELAFVSLLEKLAADLMPFLPDREVLPA